jgi:hypothetical protein
MKWEVFTQEEREIIEALIARKEYGSITSALRMATPEQEHWLGELLKEVRPISAPLESKVRKELEIEISKNPTNTTIDSPDKEAEWQKKIDEELKAHEAKVKGEKVDTKVEEIGTPPEGTGQEPKEEAKTELITTESTIKCEKCGKELKNQRSLNIHNGKYHKTI